MTQLHVLLRNDQVRFLKNIGNTSELIRRAVDEFIERQKNNDATTSPKPMKIKYRGEEVSL